MRKLTVGDQVWEYSVGVGHTVIKFPGQKRKIVVPNHSLKGIRSDDFERGQWKKTSDGMVQPSHIRAYIEATRFGGSQDTTVGGMVGATR